MTLLEIRCGSAPSGERFPAVGRVFASDDGTPVLVIDEEAVGWDRRKGVEGRYELSDDGDGFSLAAVCKKHHRICYIDTSSVRAALRSGKRSVTVHHVA